MPIKALIFDVGGVLLRTEDLAPRQKWAERLGLGPWELAEAVFNCSASAAATLGQASEAAVWAAAQERFNLTAGQLAEFRHDFFAGDRLDETLLAWIAARRGPYRTGILSNAWGSAREFLTRQPGLTAEEGLRKPQPEIYERALGRLGVAAAEAVFVDDMPENVAAAWQAGLTAIHFHVGLDLPGEMARLGVA